MLAYCQAAAEREGLAPRLYRQALHELDLPRQYQTIVACGVFGIGVSREQDFTALERFYEHLLPGGVLIIEIYPAYANANIWPLWQKKARASLPQPWPEEIEGLREGDNEYKLLNRVVAFDALEQRITGQMRMRLFEKRQLVADDTYTLTENYYFRNEMRLLLEKAGFTIEAEKGNWSDVTADHKVITFFARKSS